MKNIVKAIWNSKAMDVFADTVCGVGECLLEVTEALLVGNPEAREAQKSVEQETYEYWSNLDHDAQEYYFNTNYKLQQYGDLYFYTNREQMAKSVAEIARKENRTFCDINRAEY